MSACRSWMAAGGRTGWIAGGWCHLSIALPTYGEISAHDLARIARQMRAGQDDGWRCPAVPQDFDICLMRGPRGGVATVHVGLVAGPGHILHCEEVTGTVRVPVTHFTIAGRITGYRRRSP